MEEPTALDGVLVIDKPAGMTSHDVVARIRKIAGTKKVGHAGTLDPMATGVLVLGLGRATRLLTYLVGEDKQYLATIRLGQATTTDDADGEFVSCTGVKGVRGPAIVAGVTMMMGDQEQVPSAVSAIKVGGKRAYAMVRDGETVELTPRKVTISKFEILEVRQATADDGTDVIDIDVDIACTAGTYVRALARDLGNTLGCGGHLTALRRTRVGHFKVSSALTLEQAAEHLDVMPMARAIAGRFAVRELTPAETESLSFGRRIGWKSVKHGQIGEPVAAIAPDGRLIAMLARADSWAKPEIVFAPHEPAPKPEQSTGQETSSKEQA